MPVDTTRIISTRRTQKHISEEELRDIELKRLRGELSCAECRRLKLRCDKKVPCGSCVRRGCESICPCGILSAGQGTRFILADTDQLHRKISDMSNRIRQLEDALAILQSSLSDERHPLLSDDLLKVKFGSEALDPKKAAEVVEDESKHAIDALGTLTLGEDGEVKYFGRSAGSETLMMAEDGAGEGEEDHEGDESPIPLSPEIEHMENMLPLLSHREPTTELLEHLDSFLPSREKARHLCEIYLDHATFFFRPVKRDELYGSLVPSAYQAALLRSQNGKDSGSDTQEDTSPHATATLFFIFALGALLDVDLVSYNGMAEHYYHLGRAALSLHPVCGSPSLETVQAVGLMATYHNLAGKKYSRDSAWCIMSLAAKLAQSSGLHRDSVRWGLDPKTVQKRRNLFWEVFASDVSHSLALGRPPAIHLSYVDCEFPDDDESTTNEVGEKSSGFWALKHHYAKNVFYAVAEATLTAKVPNYETVLDLDRKVREMSYQFASNPYASKEADGGDVYHSSSLSLRDFYVSQFRTVTMIYLHRSFFAQAMLDHPANPLLSSFAPSFLTAYRCASIMIKAAAHQFDRCASMAKRVWFLLYHIFSAAIIAGTIVTRSPNSNMARNALKDLTVAIDLFERAADESQRARTALAVLRRLHEKAQRSFKVIESTEGVLQASAPSDEPKSPSPDHSPQSTGSASGSAEPVESVPEPITKEENDELAIFGGQLRVVTKKSRKESIDLGSPTSSRKTRASLTRERSHSGGQTETRRQKSTRTLLSPMTQSLTQQDIPIYPTPTDMVASRDEPMPTTSAAPSNAPFSGLLTASTSGTTRIQPASPLTNNPFPDLSWMYEAPRRTVASGTHFSATAQNFDWSENWNHNHADPSNSTGSHWLTDVATPAFPSNNQAPLGPLDTPCFPPSFDSHMFGSSDTSIGQCTQAGRYDSTRQPPGLFSSMFANPLPAANVPLLATHQHSSVHSATPFDAFSGGEGGEGTSSAQIMGHPAAVEMGLSGDSRLDASWIAFMRDCGIFGMDTS